jgi:hypothetical protein
MNSCERALRIENRKIPIVDFSPVPGVCGFGMGLEENGLVEEIPR